MRQTIFYLQRVLIVFSVITLGYILIEALSLKPDFSPQGFKNFMVLFKEYAVLFAATFVVITTNLAIERLDLMAQANSNALNASTNTFKASNRVVWMQTVKEFFSEVKEDPYLCKQISPFHFRTLIRIAMKAPVIRACPSPQWRTPPRVPERSVPALGRWLFRPPLPPSTSS